MEKTEKVNDKANVIDSTKTVETENYYSTSGKKVGDFFLGVLIYWGINIVAGILSSVFTLLVGGIGSAVAPDLGTSSTPNVLTTGLAILMYLPSCLGFIAQIFAFVFFMKKRSYISIGIVGGFVFGIVLIILLLGACYALIASSYGAV